MPDSDAPLAGKTLGGCRLTRLIGRGGMGAVYEAVHVGLQKKVAVKILPREFAGKEELRKRFLREAQAAAKLEHPNIVQVMNVGRQGDDYYIVMQLVEGESLGQILEREEALPAAEACRWVSQTAAALGFAHAKGILHRDVKPDNLLLDPGGRIRITDFGLAGQVDQRSSISSPDKILGTPYFMSPEQAKGEVATERSDVYSLGATFYYLVTGTYPLQGDSAMATLMKHISEKPVPPSALVDGLPPAVSDLIERMMEKDPARRPASMDEVRAALAPFAGEPADPSGALPAAARKVPLAAFVAGAAILVAGAAALLAVLLQGPGASEGERALEAADAFARKTPAAFAEIARRYRDVARSFPDDDAGREADQAAASFAIRGATAMREAGRPADAAALLDEHAGDPVIDGIRRAFAALDRAAALRKDLDFAGALAALDGVPDALRGQAPGREAEALRRTLETEGAVLERARGFAGVLKAGDVETLLGYLSRRRGPKEAELLLTSARVLASHVAIEAFDVVSLEASPGRVEVRVRGRGTVRDTGKPWEVEERTSWIEEEGAWALECEGGGDRWIHAAVKARVQDLARFAARFDPERIPEFFSTPDRLERASIQKIRRDFFFGSLLAVVRDIRLDTLEVDPKEGSVETRGRILFESRGPERRESEAPFHAVWVVSDGTFKIFYLPLGKKK